MADLRTNPSHVGYQTGSPVHPDAARRLLVRGLVVVGLLGVALVHLVQVPDAWHPTPTLAALFVLITVAAVLAAGALVHADRGWVWLVALLVALAPIAGYALTRSASTPIDNQDVGNWTEPLGLVAILIELVTIALAGYALMQSRGARARG